MDSRVTHYQSKLATDDRTTPGTRNSPQRPAVLLRRDSIFVRHARCVHERTPYRSAIICPTSRRQACDGERVPLYLTVHRFGLGPSP
jgi:hypothetical protein